MSLGLLLEALCQPCKTRREQMVGIVSVGVVGVGLSAGAYYLITGALALSQNTPGARFVARTLVLMYGGAGLCALFGVPLTLGAVINLSRLLVGRGIEEGDRLDR